MRTRSRINTAGERLADSPIKFVAASSDITHMAGNGLHYLTKNDWVLINARTKRRIFQLGEEIIQEGGHGEAIFIIRSGEASVEVAGTKSRSVVASLGPDDICGDMAFLEKSQATAAVIAKEERVEADEIRAEELRKLFEAFPSLAYRFYRSLAVVLAHRLRDTSKDLAREMAARDRLG